MGPENRASGLGDEAQGGRNRRQEGEAHRGSLRKHSGLMSMFIILIMVMVYKCTSIKTNQILQVLNICILLCANYTSMKFFLLVCF